MRDFLLVPNMNDFYKEKGKTMLTRTNIEYYQQKIRAVLSFQKGEWFTDSTIGVPYIGAFELSKSEHRTLIISSIKSKILNIDGIESIESFNADYIGSERKLKVDFVAKTVDKEEIRYSSELDM